MRLLSVLPMLAVLLLAALHLSSTPVQARIFKASATMTARVTIVRQEAPAFTERQQVAGHWVWVELYR